MIVDDILDTGETMKRVVNARRMTYGEVFVPFARQKWINYPMIEGLRLHVGRYVDEEWLVFPWEKMRGEVD